MTDKQNKAIKAATERFLDNVVYSRGVYTDVRDKWDMGRADTTKMLRQVRLELREMQRLEMLLVRELLNAVEEEEKEEGMKRYKESCAKAIDMTEEEKNEEWEAWESEDRQQEENEAIDEMLNAVEE